MPGCAQEAGGAGARAGVGGAGGGSAVAWDQVWEVVSGRTSTSRLALGERARGEAPGVPAALGAS